MWIPAAVATALLQTPYLVGDLNPAPLGADPGPGTLKLATTRFGQIRLSF